MFAFQCRVTSHSFIDLVGVCIKGCLTRATKTTFLPVSLLPPVSFASGSRRSVVQDGASNLGRDCFQRGSKRVACHLNAFPIQIKSPADESGMRRRSRWSASRGSFRITCKCEPQTGNDLLFKSMYICICRCIHHGKKHVTLEGIACCGLCS